MYRLVMILLTVSLLPGCQFSNLFGRSSDSTAGQRQASTGDRNRLFELTGRDRDPAPPVAELLALGESELRKPHPDTAAAREYFEKALLQEPSNVTAHHHLGIVLDLQGQYAQAERHYQSALAAAPSDARIIGDLGYSYLLQGRMDEAERMLLRSQALDPGYTNATKNLGLLYARQGDWDRAEQMFSRVFTPDEVRRQMALLAPAGRTPQTERRPSDTLPSVADRSAATTPPGNPSEALQRQLELARQEGERQRQQRERERQLYEEWQRSQAAAAGYPYSPEGERLRSQMSQIDRSVLPDNSRTLVLDPAQRPAANQSPAEVTSSPGGYYPAAGWWGSGATAQPATSQSPATGIPSGHPASVAAPAGYGGPHPSGTPIAAPAVEATAPFAGIPGATAPAATAPGVFQQAPVYRGIPGSSAQSAPGAPSPPPPVAGMPPGQHPGVASGQIQNVSGQHPAAQDMRHAYGVNLPATNEQAYYQTGTGHADPQGSPISGVSATSTRPPVSQGLPGYGVPGATGAHPSALSPNMNAFDEAARAAAIMGLGVGGGPMFPIATPLTTQISPGAGSMINGAMYPEPQRQLPTDRLLDFQQSFQFQPDATTPQTLESRPAVNQFGQMMPSTAAPTQPASGSAPAAAPWMISPGPATGSTALPPNPLASYDEMRAAHDAQVQQAMQHTQGMTPAHYAVAPASHVNPHVPVVSAPEIMSQWPSTTSPGMHASGVPFHGGAPTTTPGMPQGSPPTGAVPPPYGAYDPANPYAGEASGTSAGWGNPAPQNPHLQPQPDWSRNIVIPAPYAPAGGAPSVPTGGIRQDAAARGADQRPLIRPAP